MPIGSRPPATVRTIAAETGLSIATVSRVLNGRANVSPATRATIETALASHGSAGPTARGAATVRTAPVFLRCPYLLTDYFGLVVSAVAESLELHGVEVRLDAGEAAQQRRPLRSLPARSVSGAVLILPPESPEELLALRRRGLPFVIIDPRTSPPRDMASVSAAHITGARSATAHLLGHGHTRIGVIAGPQGWVAGTDRLAGHSAAMVDAGLMPPPELTRFSGPTSDEGYQAAGSLLDVSDRPTALVCFNDKIAVGALRAARERGLTVPEDLSVTGFDDIDLATATAPQLTTIRQPLAEMGRTTVALLIRLMNRDKVEALHMELAAQLVVRGSTGPANPGAQPDRR